MSTNKISLLALKHHYSFFGSMWPHEQLGLHLSVPLAVTKVIQCLNVEFSFNSRPHSQTDKVGEQNNDPKRGYGKHINPCLTLKTSCLPTSKGFMDLLSFQLDAHDFRNVLLPLMKLK